MAGGSGGPVRREWLKTTPLLVREVVLARASRDEKPKQELEGLILERLGVKVQIVSQDF